MIPASRVALVSSIQVNDRGKAAPAVPYRRSDLVLWPVAEMVAASGGVRLLGRTDADCASQHSENVGNSRPRPHGTGY